MTRAEQNARAELIRAALKKGTITRATRCSACGLACHTVARMLPGKGLEVRWLCRKCNYHWADIQAGARLPDGDPRVQRVVERQLDGLEAMAKRHVKEHGPAAVERRLRRLHRFVDNPLERAVQEGQRRPATKETYLSGVRSFLAHAGPRQEAWTGAAVEAWRRALGRKGVKAHTANHYLKGVKYASRRLQYLGWGPDFAAGAEGLSAPPVHSRAPVSVETARRIIGTCGDDPAGRRDRAILTLGFLTGLRRAGIAGLLLENVSGGSLRVVLKGGREHVIQAVGEEVQAALGAWIAWLRLQGVKSGPVFRRLMRGKPGKAALTPSAVWRIARARAEEAGVQNFHPHLMRHSFVSWLVAQGVSDRRIMAVTGHSDPASLTRYHTETRVDDPVADKLPPLGRK